MKSLPISVWELTFFIGIAILAIYGLVQGYRVWRNPDRWKALGFQWFASFGKLFVPREQRSSIDQAWTNEQGVRFLAILTMVLCASGLVILVVGIMVILG